MTRKLKTSSCIVAVLLPVVLFTSNAFSYSVLTHEEIIDLAVFGGACIRLTGFIGATNRSVAILNNIFESMQ